MQRFITALLFVTCSQSLHSMDNSELTPQYQDSHLSLIDDPSFLLTELPSDSDPLSVVIDHPTLPPSSDEDSETEPENPSANSSKVLKRIRKPTRCPICKKNIIGSLKFHLFTHAKKKPYECSACDYNSNQPGNVRRHIAVLHRGKAHVIENDHLTKRLLGERKSKMKKEISSKKCTRCQKEFGDNYGLKRHHAICRAIISESKFK